MRPAEPSSTGDGSVRNRAVLLMGIGLLHCAPGGAQALQAVPERTPGHVVGRVVDADGGHGVAAATVRSMDVEGSRVVTDADGRFGLLDLLPGVHKVEVTHLAYGRWTHLVNVPEDATVEFDVRLSLHPIVLDSLVVTVDVRIGRLQQNGVLERERRGWGYQFYGDEVDGWEVRQVLQRVPAVQMVQGRSAFDLRVAFRRPRGLCRPEIFLDGIRQPFADGDLQSVVGGMDLEAVEVYRGNEVPMEFLTRQYPPCGVILLWTRRF